MDIASTELNVTTTTNIEFNGWRGIDLIIIRVPVEVIAILFYLIVNLTMLFFVFACCQKQLRLEDLKEAAMWQEKEKIDKQLESLKEKTDNLGTDAITDADGQEILVNTETDPWAQGESDESDSSSDAWASMVVGGGIGRKTVVNVNPMIAAQANATSPRVIVTENKMGAIQATKPASPIDGNGSQFFGPGSDTGSVITLQAMAQMEPGSTRSFIDPGAMSIRGSIDQRNDGWDAMTVVSQRGGLGSPSSVEMVGVSIQAHGYDNLGDDNTDEKSKHTRDERMSCAQGIDYYINRLSLYLPILLHFWDMATDIGVLISWVPFMDLNEPTNRCYNQEVGRNEQCEQLNTLWFVTVSVVAMLTYRIVSGIMYARKYSTVGGFFQFLDIMLFVEVYVSLQGTRTKSTLQLRWIRRMEAIIEATPQSFLQLIYLLQTGNTGNILIRFSLAMAVMSVANSLVKSDEWNFDPKTGANQKVPPHPAFVTRLLFRLCEVFGRLVCLAFLTQSVGYAATAGILCAQFVFYWVMSKDSFLGKDVGNIVEVLIAHPNLSLRLDEEHSHGEPFFGCLLRTMMCWTPIAFAYNMCNICKSKWCNNGSMPDDTAMRQFSSETENLGDEEEDSGRGCWQFHACMNRNVVTVHFTHRFLEEAFECSIVFFVYFNKHFKVDDNNPKGLVNFRRVLFAFGTLAVVLTPLLYFIVRRWLISGGKAGGIEMNVFGFLRQAHVSGDNTLLMEFVTRVPRSVNQQKKGSERTVIHECIELNNLDLFLRLCKTKKVKLGLPDSDGITPLIACARRGLQKHLALLLNLREEFAQDPDPDRRILIEATYAYRKTSLMTCCEQGYAECMILLLENGANINAQDGLGRSAMHYAIHAESHYRNMTSLVHYDKDNPNPAAEEYRKMDDEEKREKRREYREKATKYEQLVTVLCKYNPNLELRDSKKQWTTLLEAAAGGNLKIVARLIHMGANMDVVDALGQSVLHVAVRCNSPRVLHFILTNAKRRWNHEHQNSEGDTPLRLAVHGNYLDCLRVLAPFETPHSLKKALLLGVKRNRPQIVHFLLKEFKINPNFRDKEKMTPLRWAAYYGYTDCVKYLLMYKASDELDAFGQNIVFYAAKKGHIQVLEVLEQANAHFGIINHEGQSALEKAFDDKTKKHINAARKRMRAKKAAAGR